MIDFIVDDTITISQPTYVTQKYSFNSNTLHDHVTLTEDLSQNLAFNPTTLHDHMTLTDDITIDLGFVIDDTVTLTDADWGTAPWVTSGDFDYAELDTGIIGNCWKLTVDATSIGDETATLTMNHNLGDLSNITGVSAGAPSQGSVGLWLKFSTLSYLHATDAVVFRIGSDSSNYAEFTLQKTGNNVTDENGKTTTHTLTADTWFYWAMKLISTDCTIVGNPDWTDTDYAELVITETTANTNNFYVYLDYLTISKSNYIGLNGMGERLTTLSDVTTTYT
jgi:hypothetical protein